MATNAVERQAEEKILKTFAQVKTWHTARRFTPVPVTGPLDVGPPAMRLTGARTTSCGRCARCHRHEASKGRRCTTRPCTVRGV